MATPFTGWDGCRKRLSDNGYTGRERLCPFSNRLGAQRRAGSARDAAAWITTAPSARPSPVRATASAPKHPATTPKHPATSFEPCTPQPCHPPPGPPRLRQPPSGAGARPRLRAGAGGDAGAGGAGLRAAAGSSPRRLPRVTGGRGRQRTCQLLWKTAGRKAALFAARGSGASAAWAGASLCSPPRGGSTAGKPREAQVGCGFGGGLPRTEGLGGVLSSLPISPASWG